MIKNEVDIALLKKAAKGNRRSQYLLYKHCFGMLMPICFGYTKNEEFVREELSTAFVKIVEGLGGAYSHNLSAKNEVSTNLSFTNQPEISANNKITGDSDNYKGFYQNTFSSFMSYRYMIKRFGGEINYHVGLNDMLNNEKMKSASFERSNRLTVTLVYSIL